jgi:hypothetical protein
MSDRLVIQATFSERLIEHGFAASLTSEQDPRHAITLLHSFSLGRGIVFPPIGPESDQTVSTV